MVKALSLIIALAISMTQTFAATTITFESDYGVKNVLLFIFLVALFLFWLFIYRMTEPLEFNRNNLLKSITNFGVKFNCWIWFISILYVFQSVLFISSSETFLTDKLDLLYSIFFLSLILFGILGLFNSIKLYNKMTGTAQFVKEFIYEIKSGGKK